jgi:hypothetical protein
LNVQRLIYNFVDITPHLFVISNFSYMLSFICS